MRAQLQYNDFMMLKSLSSYLSGYNHLNRAFHLRDENGKVCVTFNPGIRWLPLEAKPNTVEFFVSPPPAAHIEK